MASVGLAAGTGLYFPAVFATAVLWIILALLKPIERRFVRPRCKYASIQASIVRGQALAAVEAVVGDFRAPVECMLLRRDADGSDTVIIRFAADFASDKLATIADACREIDGAAAVSFSAAAEFRCSERVKALPSRILVLSPDTLTK